MAKYDAATVAAEILEDFAAKIAKETAALKPGELIDAGDFVDHFTKSVRNLTGRFSGVSINAKADILALQGGIIEAGDEAKRLIPRELPTPDKMLIRDGIEKAGERGLQAIEGAFQRMGPKRQWVRNLPGIGGQLANVRSPLGVVAVLATLAIGFVTLRFSGLVDNITEFSSFSKEPKYFLGMKVPFTGTADTLYDQKQRVAVDVQARVAAEMAAKAEAAAKSKVVDSGNADMANRISTLAVGSAVASNGRTAYLPIDSGLISSLEYGTSLPSSYEDLRLMDYGKYKFADGTPQTLPEGNLTPFKFKDGQVATIRVPKGELNSRDREPEYTTYVIVKLDDGSGAAIEISQWNSLVAQHRAAHAAPGPSASLGASGGSGPFSGGSGVDQLRGGPGNDHIINSSISVPNATASFAALPQTDGLGLPLSLAFMAGVGAAYNIGKRSTRPGSSGRVPTGEANKAANFGVEAAEGAAKGLEMTSKAKGGLTLLRVAGKKIPLVGAVICFGFGASETAKHLSRGHLGLAGVAAANTAVDTVFGLGGFVTGFAGDAIHESIRLTAIKVGGNEFRALHHSGSGEIANMVGQGFQSAARPTSVARGGPSATLEHA